VLPSDTVSCGVSEITGLRPSGGHRVIQNVISRYATLAPIEPWRIGREDLARHKPRSWRFSRWRGLLRRLMRT
jgi:hypothetical protein